MRRQMSGSVVGFGEHGVENVGYPAVAGRPVVDVVGAEFGEELGDVAT
jgi:hypothetical protein